jgi:hypothetical protein
MQQIPLIKHVYHKVIIVHHISAIIPGKKEAEVWEYLSLWENENRSKVSATEQFYSHRP